VHGGERGGRHRYLHPIHTLACWFADSILSFSYSLINHKRLVRTRLQRSGDGRCAAGDGTSLLRRLFFLLLHVLLLHVLLQLLLHFLRLFLLLLLLLLLQHLILILPWGHNYCSSSKSSARVRDSITCGADHDRSGYRNAR
jgi:hypothetical protein